MKNRKQSGKQAKEEMPSWNRNSVLITIILTAVFIFLIVSTYFPNIFDSNKLESFNGITRGQINSIIPSQTIAQSYDGSSLRTLGYGINYSYTVNDHKYRKEHFISGSAGYASFLKFARLNVKKNIIVIRYDLLNPENSMIDMRMKNYTKPPIPQNDQ